MQMRSRLKFKPILEVVESRALMSVSAAPTAALHPGGGGGLGRGAVDEEKAYTAYVAITLPDNYFTELKFYMTPIPNDGQKIKPTTISAGKTLKFKTADGRGFHSFVLKIPYGSSFVIKPDSPLTYSEVPSPRPNYELVHIGPGPKFTLERDLAKPDV